MQLWANITMSKFAGTNVGSKIVLALLKHRYYLYFFLYHLVKLKWRKVNALWKFYITLFELFILINKLWWTMI